MYLGPHGELPSEIEFLSAGKALSLQKAEANAVESEDFDEAGLLNLQYSELQEKLTGLYNEQGKAEAALHAAVRSLPVY